MPQLMLRLLLHSEHLTEKLMHCSLNSLRKILPAVSVEYDDTNDLFDTDVSYVDFPDISMSTDEVAMSITGIRSDKKLRLYDVFVPLYKGKEIKEDEIIKDFGKGDCMQIFAQFEAFV